MKKLLGVLFVFVSVFALVACGNKDNEQIGEQDLYALSVIGGVNDINFNMANPLLRTAVDNELVEGATLQNQEYLELMLNIMNDNSYKTSLEASDNDLYSNLLNIEINKDVYSFYYNEEVVKHDVEEDDEEFEEEIVYNINGIIVNNEITYNVSGQKTIEVENDVEDNETEAEMELELKIVLDERNYSIVKYEVEDEQENDKTEQEKELVFKTYENGKKVSEMNIDVEKENDKIEVKLVIKEDGFKYTYNFKNKNKNEATINYTIVTKENAEKGSINVKIVVGENGLIIYEF